MSLFSQAVGLQRAHTLAKDSKGKVEGTSSGEPKTHTNSSKNPDRVDPEELENCYVFDPIVFNSINKNVQTIMAAGYTLKCQDKKVKEYFENFLDSLGDVGGDITFDELLETTFQNTMIYGKHYIEIVFNKKLTEALDLVCVDPKSMDYARDAQQKVAVDRYGMPLGYVQSFGFGMNVQGGDSVPDGVALENGIFLKPFRIAHFKLYTFGDQFDGLGLIEPGYKSIVRRQNIEEAQANSIYARGTYPVIDYVGDENHYPTPKMIDNAIVKLTKMQHNRYFALPYWHKVETLEVKQSEVVDNTMKYLRENASASLGMPLAFATGSGEATNRATLNNQQRFLEYSLRDIVKRITSIFRKQIFKRICDLKNFKEIPYLEWGDIGAENVDDKATRLVNWVKAGILDPKEVKEYAMISEELDLSYSEPLDSEESPEEVSEDKQLAKKELGVEKRGNKWCVIHGHPMKPGSKTDKPKGSIIKCFPTKSEADAMHKAIIISQKKHSS